MNTCATEWNCPDTRNPQVTRSTDTEDVQVAVSATDMRGRTPVHYAAASGDWDNVQWLVAQGTVA